MLTNNSPYKIRPLRQAIAAGLLSSPSASLRVNTVIQMYGQSNKFNGKTAAVIRRIAGVKGPMGVPAKLVVRMIDTREEVTLDPLVHPELLIQVQSRGHGELLQIRKPNSKTLYANKPAALPNVDNRLSTLTAEGVATIPYAVQDLITALQNGAEAENEIKNGEKVMARLFKGKGPMSHLDKVKYLVGIVTKVQGLANGSL